MSFRRGFKTEAERLAEELRREAGAKVDEPLPLVPVAGILGARIVSADALVPRARLAELKALQDDAFSACTFNLDDGATVVFNPLNVTERQNSDIAHELAHLGLRHSLRRTERIGAFSFFTCDADQEAEANWLAGALLLPRPGLMVCLNRRMSDEAIAEKYQVSVRMAKFRLQTTGASAQFQRSGGVRARSRMAAHE